MPVSLGADQNVPGFTDWEGAEKEGGFGTCAVCDRVNGRGDYSMAIVRRMRMGRVPP